MTNTRYALDWDQAYCTSYAKIRRTVVRHIQDSKFTCTFYYDFFLGTTDEAKRQRIREKAKEYMDRAEKLKEAIEVEKQSKRRADISFLVDILNSYLEVTYKQNFNPAAHYEVCQRKKTVSWGVPPW